MVKMLACVVERWSIVYEERSGLEEVSDKLNE